MFFLGILAVFQMIFLPGFLLLRLFRFKKNLIQTLVLSFALSMMANYAGIGILVSLRWYLRPVVLTIFVLELVLLVWLYRGLFSTSMSDISISLVRSYDNWITSISQSWQNFISPLRDLENQEKPEAVISERIKTLLTVGAALLAVSSLWWIISLTRENIGTVWQTWDALASWNPWAVDWFTNKPATSTWEYPQLIPMAWSLSYIFMGDFEIVFFAKGIMPLFTLAIMLLFLDLATEHRSMGYFFGIFMLQQVFQRFLPQYIGAGYVDIPVAFMSFLAVYALLKARNLEKLSEIKHYLIFGAIISGGAAITKQPGLYIYFFYPFLAYFMVLRPVKEMRFWEKVRFLAIPTLAMIVYVAPWYIFTEWRILTGRDESVFAYVTNDIYAGLSYLDRFIVAMQGVGRYVLVFAFLLITFFFLDSGYRWIALIMIYPFSLLWAIFLSYEYRNLAVAMPFIAVTTGIGLEAIVRRLNLARLRSYVFALAIVGLLFVSSFKYNDSILLERQDTLARDIYLSRVNELLYDYYQKNDEPGRILSSYPVGFLPDMLGRWVHEKFEDYDEYTNKRQAFASDVTHLLFPTNRNSQIYDEINAGIEEGYYELIFRQNNYLFIKIVDDPYMGNDG